MTSYLTFVVASFLLIIVPGPVVTLVIGNALSHGLKAALLNVGGSLLGLCGILALVAAGLGSVAARYAGLFEAIRLIGAAYLIYLGARALIASFRTPDPAKPAAAPPRKGGFFVQGLLVGVSNPKSLLFFGAFLPQFIDPSQAYLPQIALLGATFAVMAAASDSVYAVLASRARAGLALAHRRLLDRASGAMLLGGGLWLLARGRA